MREIKTGIKLRVTPEQSRKIQEICFENGISWEDNKDKVVFINSPYLYIYPSRNSIRCGSRMYIFKNHKNYEVSAEDFIRTNGTCVESETLTENNDKGEQMEELKLECLVEGYEGTYFEVGQVWETAQGSEKVKIIQLNVDKTVLVKGNIRYSVQLNGKFNKSGLESDFDLVRLVSTEILTEDPTEEPQPKTLSEYLKENNAYESFVENCVARALKNLTYFERKRDKDNAKDIADFFVWANTDEGNDYWYNLDVKQPENLVYDMNEIIFAEVDKRIAEQKAPTETPQPDFISTEEFDQMLEQKSLKRYMVFVEGKNTPRYIHDSYDSAETVAKRLSTELVGLKVSVVEIVKEFKSKVIVEEI